MARSTLTALWIAVVPLFLYPVLLVAGTKNVKETRANTHARSEGERLFAINCSRCHMPPTSLSPRTTGTILMHMRTRARLSQQDEQALLKFMAP